MIKPNLRVTDRPWNGKCATTGLTVDELAEQLDGVDAPDWVTRAAVSVARSYGFVLGPTTPVRELAELIERFRNGEQQIDPELMAIYVSHPEKLEFPPQWPNEDPWVREVAVFICDRWTIRGLCDPGYIANTIHGEEIDADHPGQRHARRTR